MTYYITLSKHYSEKGNSTPAKTSTRFTASINTGQCTRAAHVENNLGKKKYLKFKLLLKTNINSYNTYWLLSSRTVLYVHSSHGGTIAQWTRTQEIYALLSACLLACWVTLGKSLHLSMPQLPMCKMGTAIPTVFTEHFVSYWWKALYKSHMLWLLKRFGSKGINVINFHCCCSHGFISSWGSNLQITNSYSFITFCSDVDNVLFGVFTKKKILAMQLKITVYSSTSEVKIFQNWTYLKYIAEYNNFTLM